ncbi:hypothetical protein MRB53_041759 [Persea americana]|nr:hypothetical protein MRB53_041759 [Persea americana]
MSAYSFFSLIMALSVGAAARPMDTYEACNAFIGKDLRPGEKAESRRVVEFSDWNGFQIDCVAVSESGTVREVTVESPRKRAKVVITTTEACDDKYYDQVKASIQFKFPVLFSSDVFIYEKENRFAARCIVADYSLHFGLGMWGFEQKPKIHRSVDFICPTGTRAWKAIGGVGHCLSPGSEGAYYHGEYNFINDGEMDPYLTESGPNCKKLRVAPMPSNIGIVKFYAVATRNHYTATGWVLADEIVATSSATLKGYHDGIQVSTVSGQNTKVLELPSHPAQVSTEVVKAISTNDACLLIVLNMVKAKLAPLNERINIAIWESVLTSVKSRNAEPCTNMSFCTFTFECYIYGSNVLPILHTVDLPPAMRYAMICDTRVINPTVKEGRGVCLSSQAAGTEEPEFTFARDPGLNVIVSLKRL